MLGAKSTRHLHQRNSIRLKIKVSENVVLRVRTHPPTRERGSLHRDATTVIGDGHRARPSGSTMTSLGGGYGQKN
jgi:hypothetical protein